MDDGSESVILPVRHKTALQIAAEKGRDDSGLVDVSGNPLLADLKLLGGESALEQNLKVATHLMQKSNYVTFAPLLPLMLQLKGQPFTLRDHFPFEPLFRTRMAQKMLFKSGRQVAKSTSLAAHGVVISNCIPYFSTLYLTPLFEMIRRFSQNYVRPFIETSPMLKVFTGSKTINSVLQKSFTNRSQMLFSFAFLDAERVRGVASDCNCVDEVQDLDQTLLPIIHETMSASIDYGIVKYAGTPKTLDNTIEQLWTDTSMAEWIVKCRAGGCNHWNIPTLDYDLLDMIGPYRDDISEKAPGLVCSKCRKPINPRPTSQGGTGRWEHRVASRRWDFAGYHIPQMIMPMHYANPSKWATLLGKQAGRGNTPINVFFNEVCGESYDSGAKMVTITDLKRAADLPWENKVDEATKYIDEYSYRFCAVDWGGGGVKNGRSDMKYTSYTSIAVIGMSPTGQFHVLYGYRSLNPFEHVREAKLVLGVMSKFRCSHLVHDYTGAGTVRETIIHQAGLPIDRIISVAMQGAAKGGLFQFKPATELHPRDHFVCDKPRSLNLTCQMIKSGILRFFKYDNLSSEDRGVISDFLNLIEEKSGSSFDIYKIIKDSAGPDDFAQAVNIGVMAMCHMTGRFPDFAAYVQAEISDELMEAANPVQIQNWEDS